MNREQAEILLMEYAAGTLNEASALLAASYIALSPDASRYYRSCERIGGALMEQCCDPVAMECASLQNVLARLNEPPRPRQQEQKAAFCKKQQLPAPLAAHINECAKARSSWRIAGPGIRLYPLTLREQDGRTAILMALSRGVRAPRHIHTGTEYTLILEGGLNDEYGKWRKGDLLVCDPATIHSPVASPETGCTCLIVSESPARFTGRTSFVLNFFVKP